MAATPDMQPMIDKFTEPSYSSLEVRPKDTPFQNKYKQEARQLIPEIAQCQDPALLCELIQTLTQKRLSNGQLQETEHEAPVPMSTREDVQAGRGLIDSQLTEATLTHGYVRLEMANGSEARLKHDQTKDRWSVAYVSHNAPDTVQYIPLEENNPALRTLLANTCQALTLAHTAPRTSDVNESLLDHKLLADIPRLTQRMKEIRQQRQKEQQEAAQTTQTQEQAEQSPLPLAITCGLDAAEIQIQNLRATGRENALTQNPYVDQVLAYARSDEMAEAWNEIEQQLARLQILPGNQESLLKFDTMVRERIEGLIRNHLKETLTESSLSTEMPRVNQALHAVTDMVLVPRYVLHCNNRITITTNSPDNHLNPHTNLTVVANRVNRLCETMEVDYTDNTQRNALVWQLMDDLIEKGNDYGEQFVTDGKHEQLQRMVPLIRQ
jgi:hypothetical protein